MFTRKILKNCFLVGILCCSLNSWSAPKVPTELTRNSLIYCTHASGFSFNPQTADAGTNMNVVTEQIYNKLFEIKNNSANLEPVLAQSYQISPDGKVITLFLRKGVKFHHTDWFKPTRDFNAEDVVFSLNRVLGHSLDLPEQEQYELANKNPQYLVLQRQAKKVRFPYFESIKLNEKIESVKAINPYQVEIRLFAPDASILSHLASQYAIIFSQEYALKLSKTDNLLQLDRFPIGTGAYKLKNYMRNQHVRLVKNEDYWKKDAKIDNIIIDLSTERTGRLVKFFNNECHIAAYPDVSQLGLLQKNNEKYYIKSTEGMNLAYLAINFQKPMMQDIRLRRAISQALDRQRLIRTIYHNTATVANNIIPTISWASKINTPDFAYDYQPQSAVDFFRQKYIKMNMWVLNEEQVYNPSPIKMAELIKQDFAKVGIMLNVSLVTRTYLIERLRNQDEDYDLILTGWLGGNLDPDSFMRPILGCSAVSDITNLSNWCHAPFEQAMYQALSTSNLRERAKFYNIAQEIILSELPIIPLANVKRVLVANAHVRGIEMTPFGSLNFATLSLKGAEK